MHSSGIGNEEGIAGKGESSLHVTFRHQDHPTAVAPETAEEEAENHAPNKGSKYIKTGLLLVLAALVVYVILDYSIPSLGFVAETLRNFLSWVRDNPGQGFIAFAAVYVFTTVCFIPGSLLTLGAGLVFGSALGTGLGVVVGSAAVLLGATIGALLAFLLGRYVLQEQAQALFNKFKILSAVNRAIESQGLKLVLLLRLSPVVPFSAFNYVMGLTKVSFRDYALGCFGFIPGTAAYVFIGTSASSLLEPEDREEAGGGGGSGTVQLIVIVVGVVATIIAVVLISIYAKRALNKALEEANAEEAKDNGGGDIEAQVAGFMEPGSNNPAEVEAPIRRKSQRF
ncbi:unnamed protein product [Discosporangium mesarthrocarpum]